ncbi:MAG: histidine triad nucleotide-binding protein [Holophagales bacterium]|jgi:histidine triad (HIT) family protein|nr:histidine triad nucleotide-binding protein [Holophagales bacterium]
MSDQCIFCKIINRQIPSDILHEDELVVAFRDINAQAPVHLLIVPRIHIPNLNELLPEHSAILGHIHLAAKSLANESGLAETGWRLVINCGPDACQSVLHLHVHLLGGRQMSGRMA